MIVATSIDQLNKALAVKRAEYASIGFVPTMGFLHEGHASLLRRARAENDIVVLSIFVNPLQFGVNEDFDRYPSDWARDEAIARASSTDVVFKPKLEEMYPQGKPYTRVLVSAVTERLCGASRPGHFDGVGTVVTKLFNLVRPTRAYFGMKDAQQVAVIEQMVHDLNIAVDIVRCPTQREADGLAMSSRNVYLNHDERAQAVILNKALAQLKDVNMAMHTPSSIEQLLRKQIATMPLAQIDYVEVLTYPQLATFTNWDTKQSYIAAVAVKFGQTRLIDNVIFEVNTEEGDRACLER